MRRPLAGFIPGGGFFLPQRFMKWTQTAFRFLLNRLIAWRKLITPWAFACVLFSACSLPLSFARGDDFEEFEETNSVLRIQDLDFETRVAVSNLAIAMTASATGDRAAATVEDNVDAILSILQAVRLHSSQADMFRVIPYANGSNYLVTWFAPLFGVSGSNVPNAADGYLYKIQRALFGQNGIPSSGDAVLPVLWRMDSALSSLTNRPPVDMGWTNSLSDLPTFLHNNLDLDRYLSTLSIDLASLYMMLANTSTNDSLRVHNEVLSDVWESDAYNAGRHDSALRVADANVLYQLELIFSLLGEFDTSLDTQISVLQNLETLIDNWSSYMEGYGSDVLDLFGAVSSQLDDYFGDVVSALNNIALNQGTDLTPVLTGISNVVSGVGAVSSSLGTANGYLSDFNEYMGYQGLSRRSVAEDLLYLQRQLGVDGPNPTNNIYHLLGRLFDDSAAREIVSSTGSVVAAEIRTAERSAENSLSSSSNTVARIADDEEPDWEHDRYTGDNPLDTGDSIFSLPLQQARALLPSLPDSQHKEIVLFRGDFPIMGGVSSQSRARRSVRLDVSYPLEHFDDVSSGMITLRTIMEWIWQLCSAVLCVSMLFRFYTSLATDKMNMEADSAMGV